MSSQSHRHAAWPQVELWAAMEFCADNPHLPIVVNKGPRIRGEGNLCVCLGQVDETDGAN